MPLQLAASTASIAPQAAMLPARDGTAMLLIDDGLKVIATDDSGRALLDAETGLRLSLGRLCTGSLSLNARIRDAVAHGLPAGDIRIAAGDTTICLTIIPVSAMAGNLASHRQAVAMIRTERHQVDPVAAVASQCGLTRSEADVLGLIYKGLNTIEAAGVMGVAKSTIRTHLQKVFAKTETSRQSELVHFIATFGQQ